ncbi:uncharacterized protein LOC126280671 isoform X2 [Schistocerca gregaria]|uniref:uncharacterized protein LOC126280671 isoform X2 n=1 Tax=Schistocerca gregaria TaxID=7010 RepID=UPI00211E4963|nr:uncharacterized protein LOC126280671 isoform X2 [Schistocerca gregaria]
MGRPLLFFVLGWGLVSVTADIDSAVVDDEPSDVTDTLDPASHLVLGTEDNAGATRHRRDRVVRRAEWPFDQQLPSFIQSLAKLPWFNVPWYSIAPEERPAPGRAPVLHSDVAALERAVLELRVSVERLRRRQLALLHVLRCAGANAATCSRSYVSDRRAQGLVTPSDADDFEWLLAGLPVSSPPASVPLPVTQPPSYGFGQGPNYGPGYGLVPGQGYGTGPAFGTGQGFNVGQGYGYGQGFGAPQTNPYAYQPDLLPNRSGAANQGTNTVVTQPVPNFVPNGVGNLGGSGLFRPAGGPPLFQGTSTSSSSSTGPGGTIFTSTSEQTGVDASGKPTFSAVTATGDSAGHLVVTTSGSDKKKETKQ